MYHLQLTVIKATNIFAADRSGTSDAFLTFHLNSENETNSIKTSIVKETLNPEWNLCVKFSSIQSDEKILFRLYDWNRFQSNKLIGSCKLLVDQLQIGLQEVEINFDKGGVLHLECLKNPVNPTENSSEIPMEGFTFYKTYPWSIVLPSHFIVEKQERDLGRYWFRLNDIERVGIVHHRNITDFQLVIDRTLDYQEILLEKKVSSLYNKYEEEVYTQSIRDDQCFHNLFVRYGQSIVRFCKQVYQNENQDEIFSFLTKIANDLKFNEKRIVVASGKMNFWCDRVVNLKGITELSACNNTNNSHGSFYAETEKNGEWNYSFSGNGWNGTVTVMGLHSETKKKVTFETERLTIHPDELEPEKIYEKKLFIDRLAHVIFRFQYIPERKDEILLPKRNRVEWPKGEATDSNGRNIFPIENSCKLHLPSSFVEKNTRVDSMLIGEFLERKFMLWAKSNVEHTEFIKEIEKKKFISISEIDPMEELKQFDKIVIVEGSVFASLFATQKNFSISLTCLFTNPTIFEEGKLFLLDALQNCHFHD